MRFLLTSCIIFSCCLFGCNIEKRDINDPDYKAKISLIAAKTVAEDTKEDQQRHRDDQPEIPPGIDDEASYAVNVPEISYDEPVDITIDKKCDELSASLTELITTKLNEQSAVIATFDERLKNIEEQLKKPADPSVNTEEVIKKVTELQDEFQKKLVDSLNEQLPDRIMEISTQTFNKLNKKPEVKVEKSSNTSTKTIPANIKLPDPPKGYSPPSTCPGGTCPIYRR